MNYREALAQQIKLKKRQMPTAYSEAAVEAILSTLADTPKFLSELSLQFNEENSHIPLIEGKRSFYATVLHLLHFETIHYTASYTAKLISQPSIFSLHPERNIAQLGLYHNFSLKELLEAFLYERRKYLNFLRALKQKEWAKSMSESGKARKETLYLAARRTALHDYAHIQIICLQTGYKGKNQT